MDIPGGAPSIPPPIPVNPGGFYGGDLHAWRSRAEKDESFQISAATLYRSAALVELESRVGPLDRDGLTFTHAREVFGLPADEQVRLITAAATEDWSVDRMESEASQVRAAAKKRGVGRPADPRFVKAIRRLEKLLAPEDGWFDDLDKVATLDAEETEALRKTVAAMKARCEELEGRLALTRHG